MLSKLMYEPHRIKWNDCIGPAKDFIKSPDTNVTYPYLFVKYEIHDWGKGEEHILLSGE